MEAVFQGEYAFIAEAGAERAMRSPLIYKISPELRAALLAYDGPRRWLWSRSVTSKNDNNPAHARAAAPGAEALKEFQLQVEQACIQGEIRCGSAPVPGLAHKKERLQSMLRQCVPPAAGHPIFDVALSLSHV